ncbi:Ig-like domain-containing protein [Archangium lansingense]|uniref:Ig-like domain-containing protein n=1 Tax=Archangium lansingense TaxID=2995310 RepID=A0ABT4A6F8_9BACT|nr:Ig-like domain-containing protein [Archangium lansinium]MCY1077237.1 Ig-like domain-containing protein [Archangium lansinium]
MGAHVLAAALGLYSSAPAVTVLQPLTGASITGHLEIAVQADDGPTGSGVRSVEYQLGTTSGAWTPLTLDLGSMTYRGSAETASVPVGGHELYIRAVDYTGNLRTVFVTVSVSPAPPKPAEVHPPVPGVGVDENPGLSSKQSDEGLGWGGRVFSAMLRLR